MSYENGAYSYNGTTKTSYSDKSQVIIPSSPESITSKKNTRHLILISTVVCLVAAGIVCAIAIPVTHNKTKSECDCSVKENACTSTTPEPTTKMTPKPTSPVNHGPLRNPMAETFYGPVLGHEVDMGTGNQYDNVMSYLGVRFAAPPGRWERPTEPESFTETYVASTLRAVCVQHTNLIHVTQPYWDEVSEDCLFANIYSPMDNSTLYPVYMWIYGGGYQNGANIQYPGHLLAQKGVVVVVINYRLNIFGFASSSDDVLKGNYGLWDQRQAMLYIQNTIKAYGGDPTRVTISGQSAGSASTGLQLISPETKGKKCYVFWCHNGGRYAGLFHQALMESGNYVTFWAINSPVDQPETYLPQVAQDVGCPTQNTTQMVNCLKTMNASVLLNAKFQCPFCLGFMPVIDGEYIPEYPLDIARQGGLHNVTLMTGVNTGECSLFVMALEPYTILQDNGFNRTVFQQLIAIAVDYFYFIVTETDVQPNDFYMLLNWYYTPLPDIYNETTNKLQFVRMCTDGAFVAPNAETVKYQAENSTVYMYVNGIMPVPYFPPVPDWLKVSTPHGFELPYVFGYPSIYNGTDSLKIDTGNLSVPFVCWSDKDIEIGEQWFETLWTNFVKYGNPTPTPVESHIPGQPAVTWDIYDNTNYSYLSMGEVVNENHQDYRLQAATLFTDYINYLARGNMVDNIDPYMMGPLKRTQWLNPTVAEALGVTMATQNFRKKRSLPDEKQGHAPLSEDVYNLMGAVNFGISSIISFHLEGLQLNEAKLDNFTTIIKQIVDSLQEMWPVIKETNCYNAVVPYVIDLMKNNKDEIMAMLKEIARRHNITVTAPSLKKPTLKHSFG